MLKQNAEWNELEKESEQCFQDFCDRSNLQWPYIIQDKGVKFSKSLYEAEGKRPDYLVTIPALGTVFFDVKAKKDGLFYEDYYKKNVPGLTIDTKDFKKLEKLQQQTTINVWYAIFSHLDNKLVGNCFVAPLNVISKFVLWEHISDTRWKFIQIPKQCFNECSKGKKIELKVKCEECSRKLCIEFQNKIGKERIK